MSNYNSENTTILATHEQSDGNTRMLLLHKCESGRLEYVIGSYFTVIAKLPNGEVHEDGAVHGEADGFASEVAFMRFWDVAIKDYSWDWGHYFSSVVNAVAYWNREVLHSDVRGFYVKNYDQDGSEFNEDMLAFIGDYERNGMQ